ncbi:MAG: tRNA (adenosine(37)-N6)-threonylcarbamoyltransferase complex dimerization subunit type 1 TsaB [Acidobacteria bacterium]|nr:tRNA (adenosine(37)-N6)-threonylcarbamoyltransferase complex dimerization subunit type 1 TsaB [Acidobacteriota bacterium]
MPVLALDTSGPVQSVAVASGGVIAVRSVQAAPHAHSVGLLAAIDSTLSDSGLPLARMTAIAVTCGPGAFTGLRVGMATARGLAIGTRLPLFGVSTLEVIASAIATVGQALPGDEICALTAAGRTKLYRARYRVVVETGGAPRLQRLGDESLCDASGAAAAASGAAFIGGVVDEPTRATILSGLPEGVRWAPRVPPLAEALAVLVEYLAPPGVILPGLTPNYVRDADALMPRRP